MKQATMNDRSVIAAVIQRNGHYLVCQRPINKSHGGLWEFPGGKIEDGESLRDAADRELKEELSLSVSSIGAVRFSVLDSKSGFVINFVDVEAYGEPALSEHIACRWVLAKELSQLALAPTDRQFVEELLAKEG